MDIRSLVASTQDVATQRDRTFVAGASQALADWTAKYRAKRQSSLFTVQVCDSGPGRAYTSLYLHLPLQLQH